MREVHVVQQLVRRMIEERRQQAERDAQTAHHSRTGLLTRYLRPLADRVRQEVR